jgi:hypothetical protein
MTGRRHRVSLTGDFRDGGFPAGEQRGDVVVGG